MAKAIHQVERVTTSPLYTVGKAAGAAHAKAEQAAGRAAEVVRSKVVPALMDCATVDAESGKVIIPTEAAVSYRQAFIIGAAGLAVFQAGPKSSAADAVNSEENERFSALDSTARGHIARARKVIAEEHGIESKKDARGGSNAKQDEAADADEPDAAATPKQRERDKGAPDVSKANLQASVDALDAKLARMTKAGTDEARAKLVELAAFLGLKIEA